jgi:hypothetical protein
VKTLSDLNIMYNVHQWLLPEALLVRLHNGSEYIFFRRMRTIRTVRSAEAKRLQKLLDALAVEKQLDGMARDLNSNP